MSRCTGQTSSSLRCGVVSSVLSSRRRRSCSDEVPALLATVVFTVIRTMTLPSLSTGAGEQGRNLPPPRSPASLLPCSPAPLLPCFKGGVRPYESREPLIFRALPLSYG